MVSYSDKALNEPNRICTFGRKQGYTYVEANLYPAFPNESQMKVLSDSSRLTVYMTQTGSKRVLANINPHDLYGIKLRTEFAHRKHLEAIYAKNEEASAHSKKTQENGDAKLTADYTMVFQYGEFKGKTPAQVLREAGPENSKPAMENLKEQYRRLAQNKEKYPANIDMMNAIAMAQRHLKDGTIFNVKDEDIARSSQTESNPNLAFTVQLRGGRCGTGDMSGQTPADILRKDPNNKTGLLRQRDYLMQNISKYPKNKEQVDAIDAAISLLENGQLDQGSSTTGTVFMLWKAEYGEAKGGVLGWNAQIDWTCGSLSPVRLSITNYTITKNERGEDVYSDHNKLTRHITENEWFSMLSSMDDAVNAMREYYQVNKVRDALSLTKKSRDSWKEQITGNRPAAGNE